MPPLNSSPDLSVEEIAHKLESEDDFVLLDVRESVEQNYARIQDSRVVTLPMSQLANKGLTTLPENLLKRDRQIIVFCHHGIRSALVVSWLIKSGWQNVFNMRGGIDAYARFIDPEVGTY